MKQHYIWGALFIVAGVLTATNSLINGNVAQTGSAAYNAGELFGNLWIPALLIIAGFFRILKKPKPKD